MSRSPLVIIGRAGLGAVKMRAIPVARALGVPFINARDVEVNSYPIGTAIVCKYFGTHGPRIRQRCERVIWEPLDAWIQTAPQATVRSFFLWARSELGFDELIVSTPALRDAIQQIPGLETTPVHYLPHHADPRVGPNWHDPDGPVVYAGGYQYAERALSMIQNGLRRHGIPFEKKGGRDAWQILEGASLVLSLRHGKQATELNRIGKPQVKLENAAAAGLPVYVTPHPAAWSVREELLEIPGRLEQPGDWETEDSYVEAIQVARRLPPLANPVTLEQHIDGIRRVIE